MCDIRPIGLWYGIVIGQSNVLNDIPADDYDESFIMSDR